MNFTTARALLALASLLALAAPAAIAAENPQTAVTLETALADAHRLAAAKPGLTVVRVEGQSMLPFFGNGAVLVIRQMPAAQLRPGMLVVYTNGVGERVAHRVVAADGAGWIVQGYNNDQADSTRVTDANLHGVVYATFHPAAPSPTAAPGRDALQLAALEGTPVVLAAPAK
jgi:signal peptidase I